MSDQESDFIYHSNNHIDAVKRFFTAPHGRFMGLFVVLLLIAAIPLTVKVAQQQQQNQQHAAALDVAQAPQCSVCQRLGRNYVCTSQANPSEPQCSLTNYSAATNGAISCTSCIPSSPSPSTAPSSTPSPSVSVPPGCHVQVTACPTDTTSCQQGNGNGDCACAGLLGWMGIGCHAGFSCTPTQTVVCPSTTPSVSPSTVITQFPSPSAGISVPANCPLHGQGDANCDGTIDLLDFNMWRGAFLGQGSIAPADFNNTGTVDLLDFNIWRSGFLSSAHIPTQTPMQTPTQTPISQTCTQCRTESKRFLCHGDIAFPGIGVPGYCSATNQTSGHGLTSCQVCPGFDQAGDTPTPSTTQSGQACTFQGQCETNLQCPQGSTCVGTSGTSRAGSAIADQAMHCLPVGCPLPN